MGKIETTSEWLDGLKVIPSQEWLDGLKVGDKVLLKEGVMSMRWHTAKVTRITKTLIVVNDENAREWRVGRKTGCEQGKGYHLVRIEPWKQEKEKEVVKPQRRKTMIEKLTNQVLYKDLSLEDLEKIYTLAMELKKGGEDE